MISTETQRTTYLRAPQFRAENLQRILSKTEDYRVGGVRLEHEEINGKFLFHNYGMGSSGVALAYGSAFIMTKFFNIHIVDHTTHTAVIGAGINGLMTAIELSKNKVPVTIYADKIPQIHENKVNRMVGSQIDDGVWMPNGSDRSDLLRHELLTKLSFDFYRDCINGKKYKSLKTIDLYDREKSSKDFKSFIPAFLYKKYETVRVSFGNGENQSFTKMNTFKIDSRAFLEELRVEAVLRGVKFIERKFASKEEILSLEEKAIYNCTGFSSKYLFGDDLINSTTTHHVIFKNEEKLDYAVNIKLRDGLEVRVTCEGDRIILNCQSAEPLNEESMRKMVSEVQAYFAEKSLQAKL